MATQHGSSVIEGDALELLSTFEGGFGDVVYTIAEGYAKRRIPAGAAVEISAADVEKAADVLFDVIQNSEIMVEARDMIRAMHDELKERLRQRR